MVRGRLFIRCDKKCAKRRSPGSRGVHGQTDWTRDGVGLAERVSPCKGRKSTAEGIISGRGFPSSITWLPFDLFFSVKLMSDGDRHVTGRVCSGDANGRGSGAGDCH